MQHRSLSEIREQLSEWYPTEKFDILLKCWNVDVFTEMCMQHCGEHTMEEDEHNLSLVVYETQVTEDAI